MANDNTDLDTAIALTADFAAEFNDDDQIGENGLTGAHLRLVLDAARERQEMVVVPGHPLSKSGEAPSQNR